MRRWLLIAQEHADDLVFVLGLVFLLIGIARWSVAAANIVLGVVLMIVAAWPQLWERKR